MCPWNRFAEAAAANRAFLPRAELAAPRLADLLALDDAGFREMFAGSPIKRIGRNRMIRNCLIAAGNSGDPALAQSIRPHLGDPDPVIAEAAEWALAQLGCSSAEMQARLIVVGARRRARVDMGDAERRRPSRRIEIGVEDAACVPRNCSLRLVPSRTCSAGLPKCATSSDGGQPDQTPRGSAGDTGCGGGAGACGAVAQAARNRVETRNRRRMVLTMAARVGRGKVAAAEARG